jgi:hypothetical protein
MNSPDQAPPLPNIHQEWMNDFRDAATASASQIAVVTEILIAAVGAERFADIASFAVPLLVNTSAEAANTALQQREQQRFVDALASPRPGEPSWQVAGPRLSQPFQ